MGFVFYSNLTPKFQTAIHQLLGFLKFDKHYLNIVLKTWREHFSSSAVLRISGLTFTPLPLTESGLSRINVAGEHAFNKDCIPIRQMFSYN
jgi:hypothetical protein